MIDPYPDLPHRIKNYVLNSVIGKGGFAIVYKAVNVFYNVEFAVKVICPPKDGSERILRSFESEVSALIKIDHPNVIRLYDFFQEDGNLFLVLEYCNGGSLESKIANGEVISEQNKIKICSEIISAMKYCYDQSIAHRDIKTANVLFDANGRVKVADFGLCELIGHDESFNQFNGSLCYASPEILKMVAFNPFKSDVWSLGVLIYRLFTYTSPFTGKTRDELKSRIKEGYYTDRTQGAISKIIKKMLVVDPEMRISIDQLSKSEVFTYDSQKLAKGNCNTTSSSRMIKLTPNLVQLASSRRRSSLSKTLTNYQSKTNPSFANKPRCMNLLSHPTFTTSSPNVNDKQ
ncbi:hypothetical protein M9Y10_034034 [Tritrichomonas musculus]|uniref:Protein kinase domain-containing protein n=1 Tax=Tritrichomonas musculus TaxID=1915356 RepID=A0ABR2KEF5_9EUKA